MQFSTQLCIQDFVMQMGVSTFQMSKILLIGIGGFLGAISRYLASGWVYKVFDNPWFPYGTLAVNILGCLLIGFLGGISELKQIFTPETRMLIFVGFLGGFTTFSTFGFEVFQYVRDGQYFTSLINILFHIIFGLTAVWLGWILSKLF